MNPIVEIKDLKKHYGAKEAVKGINLSVMPGELFVFLGPNGAGKTSTLKMLVGLLKPTAGDIVIGGHNFAKKPDEVKKIISFVPDTPYVYDKLTPIELLRFVGKLYSLPPEQIQSKTEQLLKFFELWDVRDTLMEEFSHGMKQKAVLSASLVHDPKVFILDEPMVGLDPVSIKSFKDFLKTKCKEGMTIIFSTHTLPLAEELADRIAIINHGELMACGTLQELHERYGSHSNLEQMFLQLVEQETRS